MSGNLKLRRTNDGSFTLFREDIDEHYHSIHGARTESEHVFIKNGLLPHIADSTNHLSILEIGFGTGYNCLLTVLASQGQKINYTGLELHPVSNEIYHQLSKEDKFLQKHEDLYLQLMNAPWQDIYKVQSNFMVEKLVTDALTWNTNNQFDLIYMDAFGFRAQQEMWNSDFYSRLFRMTAADGVLVTYAAKGIIRRGLQEIGWKVERLPGPPGKREMLRATKSSE